MTIKIVVYRYWVAFNEEDEKNAKYIDGQIEDVILNDEEALTFAGGIEEIRETNIPDHNRDLGHLPTEIDEKLCRIADNPVTK